MKAFYGAKLSPHMTESPEGFLICLGVPICRTGKQQYLPREIGEKGDGLVDVYREEDEVFKPSAMASFEGKPVTDDHPKKEVDSNNYGSYMKGVVQNVRRGQGEESDNVVCDLVIYDAGLINKIKHGKREVSCGYDCKYVDNGDGTYHQADIIGNHVAVVDNGRAGKSVSIKDSKPKGGRRRMAKKSIFARMFEAFAKDAEPEEVLEAAKAVDKACGKDEEPEPEKKGPTYDEGMEMVMDAIHELNEKIEAMQQENAAHHAEEAQDEEPEEPKLTGLDAVEAAIKKRMESQDSDMGEEEVEADPEEINAQDEDEPEEEEEESEEAEVIESDDEEPDEDEAKKAACDAAISMAMLRAIKPIVASMPPRQRQRATDALNRAVRKAMRTQDTQPLPGGYGALTKRKRTTDANNAANLRAFGEACRKRNPHNKQ